MNKNWKVGHIIRNNYANASNNKERWIILDINKDGHLKIARMEEGKIATDWGVQWYAGIALDNVNRNCVVAEEYQEPFDPDKFVMAIVWAQEHG